MCNTLRLHRMYICDMLLAQTDTMCAMDCGYPTKNGRVKPARSGMRSCAETEAIRKMKLSTPHKEVFYER